MGKLKSDHTFLTNEVGWRYDTEKDRYFSQGEPKWEKEKRLTQGKKQGALPAATVKEFEALNAKKAEERLERLKKIQEAAGKEEAESKAEVESKAEAESKAEGEPAAEAPAAEEKAEKKKKKEEKAEDDADGTEEPPKKKKKKSKDDADE